MESQGITGSQAANAKCDNTFVNHINNVVIKSFSTRGWLIDSGATYHIIYDPSLYQSLVPLSRSSVSLSNGQNATVTHKDTIHINTSLILRNVLCVPLFHVNHIFVIKSLKTLVCCSTFLLVNMFFRNQPQRK